MNLSAFGRSNDRVEFRRTRIAVKIVDASHRALSRARVWWQRNVHIGAIRLRLR